MKFNDLIHVNQIGYRPLDRKIFIAKGKGGPFRVIDAESGCTVYEGHASKTVPDSSSGDEVCRGDFSSVVNPGIYCIEMSEIGKSCHFCIKENVYTDVKKALLKCFYYQRCGVALDEEYAGTWKHDICHAKDGIVYGHEDKRMDGTGGWHDAGDYGRYVVPAAKALADLMLAFDFFPDAFSEKLNIPESGIYLPDILNECRYELEWLFKMQDRENGGVYHKLTTKNFCGMVMPEKDTENLYFLPVSSTATGAFAAIMAMAARVYKPFDEEFSSRCLAAALKSWEWLLKNPDIISFHNPPDVKTGEYGDENDRDERYWAAAELFRTTGDERYHEYFMRICKKENFGRYELGWADVGGYGTIAYLFTDAKKANATLRQELLDGFFDKAENLLNLSNKDGYGISLTHDQYIWGSNMVLLNNAMHLIIAHMLNPNNKYILAAQDHLHYIFGRNALNQCYVTGFGSKPVTAPHHRPSEADGIEQPVPGMLAGGPNSYLQDKYALEYLQGQPPARCFIDAVGSYSTNEIAIYWNSPAVFVTGYFDKGLNTVK